MNDDDEDLALNMDLVLTPLGEPWSGRTRYAAATALYKGGLMNAETLEVYRLCARLDRQDPLSIIRDRGVGRDWLARVAASDR